MNGTKRTSYTYHGRSYFTTTTHSFPTSPKAIMYHYPRPFHSFAAAFTSHEHAQVPPLACSQLLLSDNLQHARHNHSKNPLLNPTLPFPLPPPSLTQRLPHPPHIQHHPPSPRHILHQRIRPGTRCQHLRLTVNNARAAAIHIKDRHFVLRSDLRGIRIRVQDVRRPNADTTLLELRPIRSLGSPYSCHDFLRAHTPLQEHLPQGSVLIDNAPRALLELDAGLNPRRLACLKAGLEGCNVLLFAGARTTLVFADAGGAG